MNCPADGKPLVLQRAGVWQCFGCAGYLLNQRAWKSFDAAWRTSFKPNDQPFRPHPCPLCAGQMARLQRDDLNAVVDWCRGCQAIWVEKPHQSLLNAIRRSHSTSSTVLAPPDDFNVGGLVEDVVEVVGDEVLSAAVVAVVEQAWDTFNSWWD